MTITADTTLGELSRLVDQSFGPVGMERGDRLTLRYAAGFEMFGSYEAWDRGWIVTDDRLMVPAGTRPRDFTAPKIRGTYRRGRSYGYRRGGDLVATLALWDAAAAEYTDGP